MKNTVITIEYDNDGEMVNAWEENAKGDVVKTFNKRSDVRRSIKNLTLFNNADRWDGETSSHLCKAYRGKSCKTGGSVERYAKTDLIWDDESGLWTRNSAAKFAAATV